MGMQLPEWTRTMFLVASGDGWPEADEDKLWALAREWVALGDAVDALQVQVTEPVRAVRRTDWDGPGADAFALAGNGLGGQQLSGLGVGSQNVAGFVYQTGVNVQYMKIIVLEELVLLAGQIAHMLAMAGPSFGASLTAVAGLKALGQYLARAAVTGLNASIVSLAISEGLQVGVDAIGQTVQLALRTRRRWDHELTVDAAIVGAVGAMLGPVVHHGVGTPLSMVKGKVGESLTRIVGNASHEYLTSGLSGALTGRGWSGTPWDATAGATEGTVEALTGRRRHHGALPADAILDIPGRRAPVDNVNAAPGDRSTLVPADGPVRHDAALTGEDRGGRRPGEIEAAASVRPFADQPGGGREPDPQPARRLRADAVQAQPGPAHTVIAAAPPTQRVEAFEINPAGQAHRLDSPHVDPGSGSLTAAPFSAAPASGHDAQPNDPQPGAAAAPVRPARRLPEQVQQGPDSADLDTLWGRLAGPKEIKEGERDDQSDLRLNPLWYRLNDLPVTAARDNLISGRAILRAVHERYAPQREAMAARKKSVVIIRVEAAADAPTDWQARTAASRTSAAEKIKNFSRIGLTATEIVVPHDVNDGQFHDLIQQANDDPAVMGIIVQQPVHARLQTFVYGIAPGKDIDALTGSSPYEVCATAEGIWRMTKPFTHDDPSIAVVGAAGFVGRGVVRRLQQHHRTVLQLDIDDDLTRVADADIVISVTGKPGLLGPEHLRPHHRLVVDSGFHRLPGDATIRSDVRTGAVSIPQNITPVPGGIGPVEMAVLIERAVRTELGSPTPPWTYEGRPYLHRSQLSGPAAAAGLAALGFTGPTRPTGATSQQPGTGPRKPEQPERDPER